METVPFCCTRDSSGMGQMCALLRLLFSSQIANHTHSWHQRHGTDWHSLVVFLDLNTKAIIELTNYKLIIR